MRIVIKIGTNVIIGEDGQVQLARLENIAADIKALQKQGWEIALVVSGAVACGKPFAPKVFSHQQRKVLAAIGQPLLMGLLSQTFQKVGLTVGQCLLSRADFASRELYDNLVGIIEEFFKGQVIPVLNENDVLAPAHLNFGDNDSLAASFAIAIRANQLLLLTNQPGLLSGDPKTDKSAKLISVITRVDKEIERLCSKEVSESGSGGMISKVKAAQQAIFAGITAYIADGRQERVIVKILQGEPVGTRFLACAPESISAQKRWLMAAKGYGQIIVDAGAAKALRSGKSLLLPGVSAIKGLFEAGTIVEVACEGEAVSYGRVNFSDKELLKALDMRKKNPTLKPIDKEVIHRDYMIVLR